MKIIDKNTMQLDKVITDLDKFILDFIKIIAKHTKYVLISGYVSILFGRSRGTEDIDMIIPKLSYESFLKIFNDLIDQGYWFLNSDDPKILYDILLTNSIRSAKKENVIPNMEIKIAKNSLDKISLNKKVKVNFSNNSLFISPIELQIAYKENLLSSSKDMEDALFLREVFINELDLNMLEYYNKECKHEKTRIH